MRFDHEDQALQHIATARNKARAGVELLREVWPENQDSLSASEQTTITEALHAMETAWSELDGLLGNYEAPPQGEPA